MSAILKDEEFVAVEAAVKASTAPAEIAGAFKLWKKTEDMVRKVLIESGINYVDVSWRIFWRALGSEGRSVAA